MPCLLYVSEHERTTSLMKTVLVQQTFHDCLAGYWLNFVDEQT